MTTKVSHCPACGNNSVQVVKDQYYGYSLVSCETCGCVFCHPFKAPDLDFYKNAEDQASKHRHNKPDNWSRTHPTNHSNLFKNVPINRSVLDIGCGNGAYVAFAAAKGYESIGIDLDSNSLQVANRRNLKNARFYLTSLQDFIAANEGKQFDVVSMFEVMEHLDNPRKTVELIKSILKPGGYFIGSLPNENRFFAKQYNLNFALPPYHLTYWNITTWRQYLEQIHKMKVEVCENSVYYGYLSNLALQKTISTFKIQSELPIFFLKGLFTLTKGLEIPVEKLMNKSSSFYFEVTQ